MPVRFSETEITRWMKNVCNRYLSSGIVGAKVRARLYESSEQPMAISLQEPSELEKPRWAWASFVSIRPKGMCGKRRQLANRYWKPIPVTGTWLDLSGDDPHSVHEAKSNITGDRRSLPCGRKRIDRQSSEKKRNLMDSMEHVRHARRGS